MREQLADQPPQRACCGSGADETYADADDADLADRGLGRACSASSTSAAARSTCSTRAATGPALLWIHGLSANWQSWLLNIPQFMGTYRCVALDLPGFGASDMPAERTSRSPGYARDRRRACATRSGSTPCPSSATPWAGSSGPSWRSQFPTRVERLVLVSAAGLSQENVRARAGARRRPDAGHGRGARRGLPGHPGAPAAAAAARAAGRRPLPGAPLPRPDRTSCSRARASRASCRRSRR